MTKDISDNTYWRLVSVRISPDGDRPEFFCLFHEGERDRPLMHDGRFIFFSDSTQARQLLGVHASSAVVDEMDIESPFVCLDIANTLYVLGSNCIDDEGTVIDTLNLILDFLPHCPFMLSRERWILLKQMADHFTFCRDPSSFFEQQSDRQREAIETVLLSFGLIFSLGEFA